MVRNLDRRGPPATPVLTMLVLVSWKQMVVAVSSLTSTSGAKPLSLTTDQFAPKGEQTVFMNLAILTTQLVVAV